MEIRKLTADLKPALDLVWGVFLEYTAPDFSEEGVETFRRFIDHDGMASAVADGSCDLWAAFLGPAPVGVIAARGNHICLFFVAGPSQNHGVGRRLFETFRAHRLGHVSHTPSPSMPPLPQSRRIGGSASRARVKRRSTASVSYRWNARSRPNHHSVAERES